jgi:hypothetical protein
VSLEANAALAAALEEEQEMRKLTVDDILDLRAYERDRTDIRAGIIALKRRRRVALGELITVVFENTETMRWQVQEMARAERMLRDEQIAHEVETYNALIPDAGELSGTLFLELTSDEALREWLPKLLGIEFAIAFALADGSRVAGALPALRVHAGTGEVVPRRFRPVGGRPPRVPVRDHARRRATRGTRRGSHRSHLNGEAA